jgi:hypothetical protein
MDSKSITLFFCVLFSTFQAIYFRQINLAPFPLLAFLLIFTIIENFKVTQIEANFIFIFLSLILISIIISFLNEEYLPPHLYYFPRTLGWLLFPFCVVFFRKAFLQFDKDKIEKILKIILIIHLTFFFIQYLSFTILNTKIDFLYNITGEVQRTGATKLKDFSNSIRASGLFSEPGSYSVYIYILISMKLLLTKKVDWSMLAGIMSMLLSFSMTGILMVGYFIIFYLLITSYDSKKIKNLFFLLFGLSMLFYFKSSVFLGPIQDRLLNLKDDSSAEARFEGGYNYFIQNDFFYTGLGIGTISEKITASSVILGGLFELGIILLVLFILLQFIYSFKWSTNFMYFLIIIPVLMSNISFNQIIYSIFYSFITLNYGQLKSNLKEDQPSFNA